MWTDARRQLSADSKESTLLSFKNDKTYRIYQRAININVGVGVIIKEENRKCSEWKFRIVGDLSGTRSFNNQSMIRCSGVALE